MPQVQHGAGERLQKSPFGQSIQSPSISKTLAKPQKSASSAKPSKLNSPSELQKKLERAAGLEPRSLASLFKGLCPYDGQTSACYPENLGELLPQAPSPRFRSLLKKNWSGQRDSNPRPSAWEADVLPTKLCPPEVQLKV